MATVRFTNSMGRYGQSIPSGFSGATQTSALCLLAPILSQSATNVHGSLVIPLKLQLVFSDSIETYNKTSACR